MASERRRRHEIGMREERVLVVGGGLAGLTAAHRLGQAGVAVDLFEAKERMGGRAWTWREPGWPLPIELGAEFVHGKPEPTLALSRQAGIGLRALADRHAWLSPAEAGGAPRVRREGSDLWQQMAELLARVDTEAPDLSVAEFIRRERLTGEQRERFELFVRGFHAAPLEDVSLISLAQDESGAQDGDDTQYRVDGGYGELVDWLSGHVARTPHCRVHLRSELTRVTWHAGHVVAEVLQGEATRRFAGRALLLCLPPSVLARDETAGVRFEPPLADKRDALRAIGMASVDKVVLRFEEPFWNERAPRFEFLHDPAAEFPTFWRESRSKAQQITAWRGAAPPGAERRRLGRDAVPVALTALCAALDTDVTQARQALLGAFHHDFDADPFARGAYSYLRPGGVGAHAALAAPLEQTLFFAGEATDDEFPATAAGAIRSGERAARELLQR